MKTKSLPSKFVLLGSGGILLAMCVCLSTRLFAGVVTISGSFQITTTAVPSLQIGDQFAYQLQLQDSIVDANASNKQGLFLGGLLGLTLVRSNTNSGSWDPIGGIFNINSASIKTVTTSPGLLDIVIGGTGFPSSGNGYNFESLSFDFSGGLAVSDTGLGQTLGQQLSGAFPNGTLTGSLADFTFRQSGGGGVGAYGPATATVVPEPTAIKLFSLAFCLWIGRITLLRRTN